MVIAAGLLNLIAGGALLPNTMPHSGGSYLTGYGPRARFLSANNARHFAWWESNSVSTGTSENHLSERKPYSFSIRKYQRLPGPTGIGELLSISSNDSLHFAWWLKPEPHPSNPNWVRHRLMVCAGPSNSLGATRDWYECKAPFWVKGGMLPQEYDRIRRQVGDRINFEQVRFITSNSSHHFLWYEHKGVLYVFRGTSAQFDARTLVRCKLPGSVFPQSIAYLASNDQMHFAFLRDGTYMAGSSDDLAKFRRGVRYDLDKLSGK